MALDKIYFFNTYSKKLENFEELTGKKPGDIVLMYNCGPTVYSNAHIGNLSAYLMADLIRRFLEYRGYIVKQVKNITDVGHLLSDSDTGEDKLEIQARKEKKDPIEIARYYEDLYLQDEKKINLKEPFARPRATETIAEMIELIGALFKQGFAYETSDGVYFDVNKFEAYGRLSGNTLEHLKSGVRIEINDNKKSPADFALWKKLVGENEQHILRWPSPWGEGFPGWHIECSAMSRKFLGNETIDIHTGGEDNIFPHHECEIAQSEGAYGHKFVHFWMHKRHIQVEGEKMSKSKGNFYTLQDLINQGISPLEFRTSLLMSHYRSRANFSLQGISSAKAFLLKFELTFLKLKKISSLGVKKDFRIDYLSYEEKISNALANDLNTPEIFAILNQLFDLIENNLLNLDYSSARELYLFLYRMDSILGVLPSDLVDGVYNVSSEVAELLLSREKARAEKDFKTSDQLRDILKEKNIVIEDTKIGQIFRVLK